MTKLIGDSDTEELRITGMSRTLKKSLEIIAENHGHKTLSPFVRKILRDYEEATPKNMKERTR
jgi:hypothetical protein